MRRALGRVGSTLSLAALVVLLLAPAAQGKGDTLVTVVGPGLEGPLTITQGAGSGLLMKPSGFWDQACSSHGCRAEGRFLDRRPVGDLGPRYTLTWTLEFVTLSLNPSPTCLPGSSTFRPTERVAGGSWLDLSFFQLGATWAFRRRWWTRCQRPPSSQAPPVEVGR
jgi:hypothetical protein